MRRLLLPALLSVLACTEAPDALALEVEGLGPEPGLGWVVPNAELAHPTASEPDGARLPNQPRLAFVWGWGDYARSADSCGFGVDFLGGPAVSEDGRWVLHDRKDAFWESDGGESWEDYEAQEPLHEGGLALVDLHTGTTTWLASLIPEGTTLPHHADGRLHCRKLQPLLKVGVERVNAAIPNVRWRRMQPAEDLGIAVPEDSRDVGGGAVPVEFLLRQDTVVVRRKGIEVLHREDVGPLSRCNMPLVLRDPLVDVETGFTLVSIDEHCVCFGSESTRNFGFTLPAAARERIAVTG